MNAPGAWRLTILFLLLAVPAWSQEPKPPEEDLVVRPPEILYRATLTVRPDELPGGAGAQLPVRDMDPLLVTFPSAATSEALGAHDIYDDVLLNVLRAVGFPDPELRLRFPPEGGVRRPKADYLDLAEALLPSESGASWDAILATYGMDRSNLTDGPDDILYPFVQVVDAVPLEYSFLVASRRDGETVHAVRGSLIHHYEVVNDRPTDVDRQAVVELATRAFAKITPDYEPGRETVLGEPILVLLPYGNAGRRVALRYAWRMTFTAAPRGSNRAHRFQMWVDADISREAILKMDPLTREVAARGHAWNRQPDRPLRAINFEVDAALAGSYNLQLGGAFDRLTLVDQNGGLHAIQAAVQTPILAEFFPMPPANPGCGSNGHVDFVQVSLFATLHRNLHIARLAGLDPEYPSAPWAPQIDFHQCTMPNSGLLFTACNGYENPDCPTFPDQGSVDATWLSFADDSTVVAHEMGHNIVQGFTNARPDDWCGTLSCPIVQGFGILHDLADAWADSVEGTNCTAGWVARNRRGGPNDEAFSADCNDHTAVDMPRKHEVSWPPTSVGDRYPIARRVMTGPNSYADTQIAAAALWQVREGMISKAGKLGPALYLARLAEALLDTGELSYTVDDDDIGIYELLWDLERQMVLAWSMAPTELGANATNKVTAGFAKAGLFLVPSSCIDGLGGTCRAGHACNWNCPSGDTAADAVIDIEDNFLRDALFLDGIFHEENDFLDLRYGRPPTFLVWTGPEYSFDPSGKATPLDSGDALCNSRVKVEVSSDPRFATTYDSDWIDLGSVSRPLGVRAHWTPCSRGRCWIGTCYLEWTPEPDRWRSFIDAVSESEPRIYYRALTTDAANNNRRSSTRPGNGLVTVPPPYAILTDDGWQP